MNKNWLDEVKKLPSVDSNIRFFGGHKHSVEKSWSVSEEYHYAFEILIVLDGKQLTKANQHEYIINKNEIILMPPGYRHTNTCISEEGMTYFCAHFDIDEPQIHHDLICYCNFIFTEENEIHPHLKNILIKWINLLNADTSSILTKLQTEIILIELVTELLKYCETKKVLDVESNDSRLYYARCISEKIRQNFREFSLNPSEDKLETLTIKYIANQLNISTGYLLVNFKSVYNISPKSYLNQLKFNEAKILLGQPNISLSEISERIGYRNVSHFSRQFKLWSGISPYEFRNILQIKK
ncbi:TPA: helix-turn-helix transcriptional regulator [Clostridium botulinum]|uniref:helix-turn-helix domain-containing protein n=1 Tax=Clostridium botulinum TaxID=1491 RepID=UPI000D0E2468|nr:AraC family transcriptional regulator [Clostridium botulinum]PSM02928.1 AraC family transcriptional regulator [Clostridium botulinum]HDK7137420.1 helix-turn-helix transcriptional regulator [Clostridium botulinum]HDK7141054.1 helix-turn-helix transcriptional regulator [Clostridium botulinum]HDK7146863.1 helix-turn-helix transcriptional regulator [Clostridium botulinum]HDK7150455.1 helix-turn-helix transcriptional regulator [Clostridium botulinum]